MLENFNLRAGKVEPIKINTKNMPQTKKFRLKDIEEEVDRDKTTLIRWEREGLIPKAKRDSRGWRYYSQEEIASIVHKVIASDYFRNTAAY